MKRIFYILAVALSILSCTDEIDESNRYTFTGETVADFMLNRSEKYSHMITLLKRANLFGLLATYGQYTLFLPDNEGIEKYIQEQDSIYQTSKDTHKEKWTGITSPYFEDLSDSMANVIARTHLIEDYYRTTEFSEGALSRWNFKDQYLGINYKINGDQYNIMVNNYSTITSSNNEVENGIIHKIDKAIASNESYISRAISNFAFFSIFNEALRATGFEDSLQSDLDNNYKQRPVEGHINTFYEHQYPVKKYHKYTVFIETDEVFNENGIYNLDDLKKFAEKWYGKEDRNNLKSSRNALYKFIAYHFTKGEIPYNKLIISHSDAYLHYIGYDIVDYLESMSGKMIKVVKPLSTTDGKNIYINYSKREMPYKAEMHKHLNIKVLETTYFTQLRKEYSQFNPSFKNGTIHPIDKILVYDEDEMQGNIFNERMRFDVATLLPELSSNNIRHSQRTRLIPFEFCENIKNNFTTSHFCYSNAATFDYFCDYICIEGNFDFSIRLPRVPHRTYEIRISRDMGIVSRKWQNKIQIYLDNKVCGLPIDTRIQNTDSEIGWISDSETYDNGVELDKQMHNRGWMKAPDSYLTLKNENFIPARENEAFVRKVVARNYLGEGEHWLRFKCLENAFQIIDNVITPDFILDYIELVPLNIISDPSKPEDRH